MDVYLFASASASYAIDDVSGGACQVISDLFAISASHAIDDVGRSTHEVVSDLNGLLGTQIMGPKRSIN